MIGANPAAGMGDPAYQPRFEGQAAYWIQASRNTLLDRVQAYDTYGDFVYVAPGTDGLLVRNSTFARNGRQGWTINGSNITFDHNSISETRRATIDIEPTYANWSTRNVTISNNVIGHGRGYFVANKGNPPGHGRRRVDPQQPTPRQDHADPLRRGRRPKHTQLPDHREHVEHGPERLRRTVRVPQHHRPRDQLQHADRPRTPIRCAARASRTPPTS